MAENTNNLDDKLTLKLEKVLLDAKKVSSADGATLYMLGDDGLLHFSIMVNDTLKTHMGGSSSSETDVLPLRIYNKQTGEANNNNVCTSAFANKKVINIADIHDSSNFDFSGTFMFDSKNNYKTVSILTVPLFDLRGDCIAVMQLINAKDKDGNITDFSHEIQESVNLIAGQAAVLVENSRLIQESHKLLEDFTKIFYRAIEQKSKSLAKHCEQVPVISKMLLSAACRADTGKFKDFNVSDDELHSFNLASWLNDFGKLTTPDYLADKQTKLDVFYNRIESIRLKFEILLRDARISSLEGLICDPSKKAELEQAYKKNVTALREEFAFIAKCNLGDTTLTDKGISKLNDIAKRSFTNYFDRTLGHFNQESDTTDTDADSFAGTTNLLEDKSENTADTCNHGEVYNLSAKTGILTSDEQSAIQNHLENSINILKEISLPTSYQYVMDYAASQHERVDGQGYPNHLTGEQIAIPARIIALANAFEKLSSSDGKQETKKLSQILNDLYTLVQDGALDPDIFNLFLTSGVYNDYAKEYMLPEQCDDPDISEYTKGYDDNAPLIYADPVNHQPNTTVENSDAQQADKPENTSNYASSIDFLGDLNSFSAEPTPLDVSDNTPLQKEPIFNPHDTAFEPASVSHLSANTNTFTDTAENTGKITSDAILSSTTDNIEPESKTTDTIASDITMPDIPDSRNTTPNSITTPSDTNSTINELKDDEFDDEFDDDYGTIPNLEEDSIPEPQPEPAPAATPAPTPVPQENPAPVPETVSTPNIPAVPDIDTLAVSEPAKVAPATIPPAEAPVVRSAPMPTIPPVKPLVMQNAPTPVTTPVPPPVVQSTSTPATTPVPPPVVRNAPTPITTPVPPPVIQKTTAPVTMPPILKDNREATTTVTPIATVEPPLLKEPN